MVLPGQSPLVVKRMYFITKDEAEQKRKELNDPFITHKFPVLEMEDGSVIYAKTGGPASMEYWYQ